MGFRNEMLVLEKCIVSGVLSPKFRRTGNPRAPLKSCTRDSANTADEMAGARNQAVAVSLSSSVSIPSVYKTALLP